MLLPVKWGFWKTRYCLMGPSQVCYFKKTNFSAVPDEVVSCDGVEPHFKDPHVVCMQRAGQTVAWLMLVDAATRGSFIAAAVSVIQAMPVLSSMASEEPYWLRSHTSEEQQRAVSQMQLEAVQAQLKRHETELSMYREQLAGDGAVADSIPSECSVPACTGLMARSGSSSSSDEDEAEPLATSIGGAVMDWPLSRAEKKLRLMQILDRERAVAERQNRRLKRRSCQSCPDATMTQMP